MMHNLSQTGSVPSPSANMLSFSTPNGLGIDGITPSGLGLLTPSLGGAAMIPSMSELGLTVSGGKRNEDEERRAKMRRVLKAIGKPKGRVSEEGIARVSRRVGFANDIDVGELTPEEKERKVGNRPIAAAGNTIVIEIDMKDHVPRNVQVMYSVESEALQEQGARAGRVLLNDLKSPEGAGMQVKLDRFAENLERLARLDRLSSGGVNCFEALAGVYTSLRRLYDEEKKAALTVISSDGADDGSMADKEVVCRQSGIPLAHERGKLGLAIDYWKAGNFRQDDETRVGDEKVEYEDQIFTLNIEVEPASANSYPSIRVSTTWLPDPLRLSEEDLDTHIPWQDPPPTFLTTGTGDVTMDGTQRLPDLRFVTKLEPPLIMPYQTAMNILAAVGVAHVPIMTIPLSYSALLLGQSAVNGQQPLTFSTSSERDVYSERNGEDTTIKHRYTLTNVKPDWGYTLSELPFSHPRQLIELLPTLRQWALTGQLLKGCFTPSPPHETVLNHTNGAHGDIDSLDDLLDAPNNTGSVPVTIALATSPTPTLDLTFPHPRADGTANISVGVQILPNAHLVVVSEEGVLNNEDTDSPAKMPKFAKALEVCCDLSVWIEWLRCSAAA